MKLNKRLMSILLCLVMLIGCVTAGSVSANAENVKSVAIAQTGCADKCCDDCTGGKCMDCDCGCGDCCDELYGGSDDGEELDGDDPVTLLKTPVIGWLVNETQGVRIRWYEIEGAVRYRVYRKGSQGYWEKLVDTDDVTYTDVTVKSGERYYYTVCCISEDGSQLLSEYNTTGWTTVFSAPLSISLALQNTQSGVQLYWSGVKGAVKYKYVRNGYARETIYSGGITDTSVHSGETYTYYVIAIDGKGNELVRSESKTILFFKGPSVQSLKNTPDGVQVTWNSINSAYRYRVYRRVFGATKWNTLVDTEELTYLDTTAQSGVKYEYGVAVINDSTTRISSFDALGPPRITYLSQPKNVKAQNDLEGVKLSWDEVSGATEYRIYAKDGDKWTLAGSCETASFVHTMVVSGKQYTYAVRAAKENGSGVYSYSEYSENATVTYVPAPRISSLQNVPYGVEIKWNKVAGVSGYKVFVKNGSSWKGLAVVSGDSCLDTSAKSGINYTYTVRGVNENGEYITGYDREGKSVTFFAVPAAPTLESATQGVKLRWNKLKGEVKYRVFRMTQKGVWKKLGDTASLTYTDKNVKSGETYRYTVAALNKAGTEISDRDDIGSEIKYIATPKISKVENVLSGAKITWGKVKGATRYKVFIKNGSNWKGIATVTGASYINKSAKSGTKYTYTVRAVDKNGEYISAFDPVGKSRTFISAPKNPTLKNLKSGVKVSWKKVTGASKYRVFRKTASGSWKKLYDTTKLTYTDKTAKSGVTYYYTIRCITKSGKTYTSAHTSGAKIKRKK